MQAGRVLVPCTDALGASDCNSTPLHSLLWCLSMILLQSPPLFVLQESERETSSWQEQASKACTEAEQLQMGLQVRGGRILACHQPCLPLT